METCYRQVNIKITKEDHKILEALIAKLGESQSQVMRRALNDLYHKNFKTSSS